jgi:hypothetical protein
MLQLRLLALRVRRHARRFDIQLRSDVLDHLVGNVTRIGEEGPHEADRRQLDGEAQPVVIAAATTHEAPIAVVEEEKRLELHP